MHIKGFSFELKIALQTFFNTQQLLVNFPQTRIKQTIEAKFLYKIVLNQFYMVSNYNFGLCDGILLSGE